MSEDGDVWAFMLPPFEAGAEGEVVTGGGEIVGAFSDDEAVVKVQEYLSSPEWANSRVSLGGVISANKGLDPANAQSAILQAAIEILQSEETTFRFDGSDLMPSAVGTGSFWQGMRDWVNGASTDQVLEHRQLPGRERDLDVAPPAPPARPAPAGAAAVCRGNRGNPRKTGWLL